MNQWKYIFIAALVAAASSTSAGARPFGADYGFDELDAAVQSAREAPTDGHPDWLAELFEHPINPDTGLKDEGSTTLVQQETRLPGPGQKNPEASRQPRNLKE